MKKFCDKFFPIICNSSPALSFCLLALSCLCICPAAEAWTTNAFGFALLSYDELDDAWSQEYEEHMGSKWPGLSDYLNSIVDASYLFRDPLPHITGRFSTDSRFTATNAFQLVSLNSGRSYLFDGSSLRSAAPEDVPNMAMYEVADYSNLVQDVVSAIDLLPCTTNDSPYPFRRRNWQILGAQSRTRVRLDVPQFVGFDIEAKTVPFPWSGFWAGWYVDVFDMIDNGVDPSIFGSLSDTTEPNILWYSTNSSIFGAFSNVNVSVKHRWK